MSSSASSCTDNFTRDFYDLWHNYSPRAFNGNTAHFDSYICQYAKFGYLKELTQPIERQLVILFSICGFLGGLLTILTLSQKRFRVLDFHMYRLIGYLEMGQMADLAIMDLLVLLQCDLTYACTFLWAHVGFVIMNVCADAIDSLVLFLCVERTVACLLPLQFQKLHSRTCFAWVFIVSVFVASFFNAFSAFELSIVYDENTKRFRDEPSEFGLSNFYSSLTQVNTARFYTMAALILIATIFSICGFCAVAKRRKHLAKNMASINSKTKLNQTFSNRSSMTTSLSSRTNINGKHGLWKIKSGSKGRIKKVKKRETELCCLQLCLAIPIIVNHILYATGLNMNYAFVTGEAVFKKGLEYEKAKMELDRAMAFNYLRMATNLTNVLAHALHFYLYILFSVQVRRAFVMLWKKCRTIFYWSEQCGNKSISENHVISRHTIGNEISVL